MGDQLNPQTSPHMPEDRTHPIRKKRTILLLIVIAAGVCVFLFFVFRSGSLSSGKTSDSETSETSDDSSDSDTVETIDQETVGMSGSFASASSDASAADGDYVLPNSSTKQITAEQAAALSNDDLQIAINEIYARHGYAFQTSQKMMDYFASKSWYTADPNMTDMSLVPLTDIEQKNLDILVKERDARKAAGTYTN